MSTASPADRYQPAAPPRRGGGARGLWLLVVAAFALLAAVYVVAVHFGREAHIREVPLATPGARP